MIRICEKSHVRVRWLKIIETLKTYKEPLWILYIYNIYIYSRQIMILILILIFQMTLKAERLFPGHLFKIFIDCIDEKNVRHRESESCVLFKYVGENKCKYNLYNLCKCNLLTKFSFTRTPITQSLYNSNPYNSIFLYSHTNFWCGRRVPGG